MSDNNGGATITFIVAIIIGYFIGVNQAKYEGQSAEDWYNEAADYEYEYNALHDCIESYSDNPSYCL